MRTIVRGSNASTSQIGERACQPDNFEVEFNQSSALSHLAIAISKASDLSPAGFHVSSVAMRVWLVRRIFGVSLVFAIASSALACVTTPKRLSVHQRNYYFMLDSPAEQQSFLKLRKRDRESKLEADGYMEQWRQLTPAQQEAVSKKQVLEGFPIFAAHAAWGLPADSRQNKKAEKSFLRETYIQCTSGPRNGDYVRHNLECDGTSAELQLLIVDGIVTELTHLD